MILGENIDSVYSNGREIQRVYSLGKLVWEKKKNDDDVIDDYSLIPFTVQAVEDGVSVQLFGGYVRSGNVSKRSTINYKYSINGGGWIQTTSDNSVYLNQNDTMRIIGEDGYYCDIKGLSDIYGNIMSLRHGDEFNSEKSWYGDISSDGEVHSFGFFRLSNIRNAENLILPAVELGSYAYASMFADSETLIAAPKILPATELGQDCYYAMFYNCKKLTSAPKILPATKLRPECYRSMFEGCTSLTTAPVLPATLLMPNCYVAMFSKCTKLNYIKCKATGGTGGYEMDVYIGSWTSSVSPTGTLVCYKSFADDLKPYIPSTWTVEYITE